MTTPRPIHPRHPTHLVGSRWTRLQDEPLGGPYLHYEVIAYRTRDQNVRLRSLLSPPLEIEFPWRRLRDRERWTPGWASVVEADE